MFSKKPAGAPRLQVSNRTMANSTFSVLGADTAIKGDISASADLHVDGKVEGDITCASLVQGETSEVFGTVTAEKARLSGRVHGSIVARELVVLKTAHIQGDVQYDALTIEQGAQVDGRFTPRSAQLLEPSLAGDSNELLLTVASPAL
jgi:cytoskeletal protein CcmA (bactofilin family)